MISTSLKKTHKKLIFSFSTSDRSMVFSVLDLVTRQCVWHPQVFAQTQQ